MYIYKPSPDTFSSPLVDDLIENIEYLKNDFYFFKLSDWLLESHDHTCVH